MLARRNLRLLLLLAICCTAAFADPISSIRPTSYVTDLAGVLDAATSKRIEALCTEVDQKTGAQIAVVTVKSLDGRPIEEYAVDLFKHLGVGKKDDRGVLLLVAPNDRRYRFEVGYGLEPVINDARAGDIGREMVPFLRQNQYSRAIELGSDRVANVIATASNVKLSREPMPATRSSEKELQFPLWAFPLGLFGFFALINALNRGGRRRRRRGGGWWIGPMGGFGGGGGGWSGGGGWGGSSGGFGGFGGGSSGGGGASGSW